MTPPNNPQRLENEPHEMIKRYARRDVGDKYSFANADVLYSVLERQKKTFPLLARAFKTNNFTGLTLTEVGCGSGGNLLEFLRAGFVPEHVHGLELLKERVIAARHTLPSALNIYDGDALSAPILPLSQDIVYQSVVFSSLLDDNFQAALAEKMWSWVRKGGGVLWYDFIYDNPSNPDVRCVPITRIKELFPDGKISIKRVTLAPPIARRVGAIHPSLYNVFNFFPFLRTHVLCWIEKT